MEPSKTEIKELGCLSPFVQTFDFSEKANKSHSKVNVNNKQKAYRRLHQQLQILQGYYVENYGYFD